MSALFEFVMAKFPFEARTNNKLIDLVVLSSHCLGEIWSVTLLKGSECFRTAPREVSAKENVHCRDAESFWATDVRHCRWHEDDETCGNWRAAGTDKQICQLNGE